MSGSAEITRLLEHWSGGDQAALDRLLPLVYNELRRGDVAYRRGDMNEAERLGRAAIDEYRKLPAGNYVEMATSLSNLGAVLMKQGRYADAEPPIREGLEIRRKVLGDSHLDTGMSLYRLSDLLYTRRDYRGAESAARESVHVFNRALPSPGENVYFANPLTALGLVLNKTGRSREAEAHLREALGIRTRLLPNGSPLVGASEGALGECLTTDRRFAEAEPLLLRSYRVSKSSVGDHDPRTRDAVQRLITLYESWGRANEAARYRRQLPDSSR